jgi:hypothetical protein
VFLVSGYTDSGTADASSQFGKLMAAHKFEPCSTPDLSPTCDQKCKAANMQCGSIGGCGCGSCGACQTCSNGKCVLQSNIGKECGNSGCYECVGGQVQCVGENCGICTAACGAVKTVGCGVGAAAVCLAAGVTGPWTTIACVAVVGLLCNFGINASTNCEDACYDLGWCPEDPC